MPHKQLKSIPRRLGYILGAQWTRDLSWTIFTILLAWHSKEMLGQIMLALSYGYLVKTAADVGLNDFLLSTFVRKDPRGAHRHWLRHRLRPSRGAYHCHCRVQAH